ncbi:MAG: alpha/beta fold hydrolase [Rhodospirillales bacterium]|nr:MAG: alpha/beta fold hydrolase [Rhodospirillales bacterium]
MATLDAVESRLFTTRDFKLDGGATLPVCEVAYETHGAMNAAADNVVLITHGYTSSAHVAGRYAPGKAARGVAQDAAGWWDALIGPGKAIDTDRYFVVSTNALGSCHGSTGPASVDPATGKPYGPTFPEVTLRDSVRAQRALLDSLGVKRLLAVVGPSMGGFQAFQWSVTYPDFMKGVVPTVTAPSMPPGGIDAVEALRKRLAGDPNWNGGWYYENGGIKTVLAAIRHDTLVQYGQREILAATIPDPAKREAAIEAAARAWAETYDGHALIALRQAIGSFDIGKEYDRIKARVLYVIAPNDKLFPGALCVKRAAELRAAGVDVTYVELVTDKGHMASHVDALQWAPALRAFLARLEAL